MAQAPAYSSQHDSTDRRDSYTPQRRRLQPRDVLVRSAVSELMRNHRGHDQFDHIGEAIQRVYGGCPATLAYVARTLASPAHSTTVGWAAELVGSSIADFLADMARESAFAALAGQALNVTLPAGTGSIKIPARAAPIVLAGGWIAEGSAKPVAAITLGSVSLTPSKLCAISVFSEELLEHSTPSIEAIVTEALKHDLGGLLDSALLDSAASSALRPSGLFQGVTPIVASVLTPTSEAMAKDIGALAGAVCANAPDARPVYIASVTQHARLVAAGYQAIRSGYLAAGTVACVDAGSIAMMASPPVFGVSRSAAVHMNDVPLPLSATGSPNVVSAPLSSMFQTDNVAIRSTMKASWVRRRAGCTAIIASVAW